MLNPGSAQRWLDAERAMAAIAVAPHALGGIMVHSAPGPIRDIWLEQLGGLTGDRPLRRIPLHVSEARLLGGIDLGATLQSGKLCIEQGLLHHCNDGLAILAMAERAERRIIAQLCSALDHGSLSLARSGIIGTTAARIGVIALDEGIDDEAPHSALAERLALRIDLDGLGLADLETSGVDNDAVQRARQRWQALHITDAQLEAIAATSLALGVDSPRALLLTARLAQVLTALDKVDGDGDSVVSDDHVREAIVLCMAHRATRLPAEAPTESPPEDEEAQQPDPPESPPPEDQESDPSEQFNANTQQQEALAEQLVEAAQAAIPKNLLELLRGGTTRGRKGEAGKAGVSQRHKRRGRPVGVAPGDPSHGERLNLIATLRAAAPWQRLRSSEVSGVSSGSRGLSIRKQDFRVTRFKHPQQSATVFVVDASGSAAMHRMAEAKGAVELLLADCYVRRDTVALIAFRGDNAELLLPPTRSLVRAKRALAALPGGGGTPLASAIEMAATIADQLQRQGSTPTAVFLTDGVANIARDGRQGRTAAREDADLAAQRFRREGIRALVIDASPRAQPRARELAEQLGSRYLAMPNANAAGLRDMVTLATAEGG